MTRLPLLPRLPWIRRLAFVFPVLLFFGCRDGAVPTAPPSDGPAYSHSVGVNGGNGHFFFLAPLVPAPTYSGSFDGSLAPVVRICEWSTAGCGRTVAEFSKTSGTGSEVVRVDATAEQYLVNWHTDRCAWGACTLDPAKTYRLRVLVAGVELGHADVQVAKSGREVRNLTTATTVKLVNGRTLPVKFRIEVGAISVLSAGEAAPISSEGGTVALADGSAVLAFPTGALTNSTPISIAPVPPSPATGSAVPGTVYEFGPHGTQFSTPVTLTLRYPAALPAGIAESRLRLYHHLGSRWELVPGSRVDPAADQVSGAVSHFSEYGVLEAVATVTVTPSDTILSAGMSAQLSVELRDSAGQVLTDRIVTWTSSDPAVATVDPSGLVTTLASGTAVITAASEGVSDAVQVTVMPSGIQPQAPIAFTWRSSTTGSYGIRVLNTDGTGVRQITSSDAPDYAPAWSPDGSRIAFVGLSPDNSGGFGVYSVNADGSGRKRLSGFQTPEIGAESSGPAWSVDGARIAVESNQDGGGKVYVVKSDGSGTGSMISGHYKSRSPVWSPDGTRLVVKSSEQEPGSWNDERGGENGWDLYLMNGDGSGVTRLTNLECGEGRFDRDRDLRPTWSPRGERIAFDGEACGAMYLVNANGTGLSVVTRGSDPVWSPDGSKIAFVSYADGNANIYVINADGTGQTRLTDDMAVDFQPAWSPDGTQIAFVRNGDVYIMGADGSNQTNVTNSPDVEAHPAWRR